MRPKDISSLSIQIFKRGVMECSSMQSTGKNNPLLPGLPFALGKVISLLALCESQEMAHPSTGKTQRILGSQRKPSVLPTNPCFSHRSVPFRAPDGFEGLPPGSGESWLDNYLCFSLGKQILHPQLHPGFELKVMERAIMK